MKPKAQNVIGISVLMLGLADASLAASHFKVVFIDQYDRDIDGKVSSIEFETARRDRFDLTDMDGNGTVDEEEYVLEYENRMDLQLQQDREEQVSQTATRFGSLDRDESGLISWEEYEASGMRAFTHLDKNEDNLLNSDDEVGEQESAGEAPGREQILADRRRILSMPSTHSLEGTVTQYDADGDDAVSLEEFSAHRRENFTRTDRNGDGMVDPDEYLIEFEDRLDREIAATRSGQVDQTRVRFGALDDDENGVMTFEEYQMSGHRFFKRNDTDGDGFVTWEEPDPVGREFASDDEDDNVEQS